MNELVFSNNGQIMTNSLLVAEKFGKNHFDVLDAIKDIFVKTENSFETENQQLTEIQQMFILSEYEVPLNNGTNAVKKAPMYLMNRDGFSLLVMGFTGQKALQFKLDFIKAFNHYEQIAKEQSKLSPAEMLLRSAQLHLENERRINKIEDKIELIEAKITTRPNYFTIVGYATLNKISCGVKLASSLGRKATKLCKNRNIPIEYIPDPRFGIVKTYPIDILEEVFNTNIAK